MEHLIRALLLICCLLGNCSCAKILGVFILCGRSHYRLGNSLMRGLAEAGHDVTIISPYEDLIPTENGSYRNIVLTGIAAGYEDHLKRLNLFNEKEFNSFTHIVTMNQFVYGQVERAFNHPNVKKFLRSNETFDAVIIEQFSNDAFQVLPHHFHAHYIAFSPIGQSYTINNMVGNPSMTSYAPGYSTNFPIDMTLLQRIHNTLLHLSQSLIEYFFYLHKYEKLIAEYFPDAPSIYDLHYNASLVLLNSHESLGQSLPMVPNMKNIGGFHVQKPQKLPGDLQKFMDDAENGVVLFSFGSNLRMHSMDEDKRKALINALGKLKQRVLWKWEQKVDSQLPPNIKTVEWLPQMDILAHPNIKLFVTHGGLLSQTETVYNGVPVLVIPVFGDQALNANNAVFDGYGLSISYQDSQFGEEKLTTMLNELLSNPKYMENAKRVSRIYHDRPMNPMKTAAYWVDYVIQHQGAPHLRVAGLKLPWYKHILMDVSLVVSIFILFLIISLRYSLEFVTKIFGNRRGGRKIKNS